MNAIMKNSSELNMSSMWCVVNASLAWVLPTECSSILLVLLNVKSKIFLGTLHSLVLVDAS